MKLDDNKYLTQALKSGKSKAYDFLIDLYYTKLCAYAHMLTRNQSLAEDIVQDVFVKLWSNRKHVNIQSSLKAYLYKSVYNEFVNQNKRKGQLIYLEKKHLEALSYVIDFEHEDFDILLKLLQDEIELLPKKCKQIFKLNKQEGLTHSEIANFLGISTKTVEGHMTKAFKTLNKRLGKTAVHFVFMLLNVKSNISISHLRLGSESSTI